MKKRMTPGPVDTSKYGYVDTATMYYYRNQQNHANKMKMKLQSALLTPHLSVMDKDRWRAENNKRTPYYESGAASAAMASGQSIHLHNVYALLMAQTAAMDAMENGGS